MGRMKEAIMGLMKETFEDYVYAGDESADVSADEFMDYLPDFPEEMKVGSLSLGSTGVMLRFSPYGYVLSMTEIPTPIKPLSLPN
jgi:hypothetical protein